MLCVLDGAQSLHDRTIRTIAAASTVLLKNTGNILPLKNPRTIGIIGNGAGPNSRGINGCTDRGCNDGVLAQGQSIECYRWGRLIVTQHYRMGKWNS